MDDKKKIVEMKDKFIKVVDSMNLGFLYVIKKLMGKKLAMRKLKWLWVN